MSKIPRDLIRILSLQYAVVVILVASFTLGYIYRKPLLITYHRLAERSAIKAMRRCSTPELRHDDYRRHEARFKRHRKALIRLGYLEKRTFHPEFLSMNSEQAKSMLAEFRGRYPGCSYTIGWGSGLTIEDRPDRMPVWEQLVRKHDTPTQEQLDLEKAILGQWQYLPSVSQKRQGDGVWNHLDFRNDGKVEWSYDYGGKLHDGTDFYRVQWSGKIDKYCRQYPIIHMWSTEPTSTRGSMLVGVSVGHDSRLSIQQGDVLKFTDPDGYESVFKRSAQPNQDVGTSQQIAPGDVDEPGG